MNAIFWDINFVENTKKVMDANNSPREYRSRAEMNKRKFKNEAFQEGHAVVR
jgi:hypothetical protein